MRKLAYLCVLLAIPSLAWGQGVRVDNPGGPATRNVQNFLAPIPGASITVCTSAGSGTPCTPVVPTSPVTLCTDSTCSTAAANPFPADANGNWGFWAIPGTYKVSITATGVTGQLLTVTLPCAAGVSCLANPVNLATQVTGTLPGANMSAVNLAASGNGGVTGTLPGANYAAVNLAAGNVNGGVTGTLPGGNMAATNLAGGNNPGGVSGVLPPANEGTGTPAAGKYVDGGTGAWTAIPATGATEFTLSWGAVAPTLSNTTACPTTLTPTYCVETVFAKAHTLVRITYTVQIAAAGCTTNAQVGVKDVTTSTVLSSVTVNQAATTFVDSGALSVAMTAGDTFVLGVTTGPSGCTTAPAVQALTAVFQ